MEIPLFWLTSCLAEVVLFSSRFLFFSISINHFFFIKSSAGSIINGKQTGASWFESVRKKRQTAVQIEIVELRLQSCELISSIWDDKECT